MYLNAGVTNLANLNRVKWIMSNQYHGKKEILRQLEKDGGILMMLPNELKSDKETVLVAVNQNGYSLKYASDELKDDVEVVLCAVRANLGAYRFVSDRLKRDEDVISAVEAPLEIAYKEKGVQGNKGKG